VGKKKLISVPHPWAFADGISVLVEEDRVLFAGDAFMPLPYIVDGDYDELVATTKIDRQNGTGEYHPGPRRHHLRGEIEDAVKENLAYLAAIRKAVKQPHASATRWKRWPW
jgi:cyclase